ncbi:MAG: hypothetical protein Q3X69_02750, partial [Alistipes sp.]|nr:hypothetical protein [Alistipes sp.]
SFLCAPDGDLFFRKGNRRFQTVQALLRCVCAAKSSSPNVERIFRHSLVRIASVTFWGQKNKLPRGRNRPKKGK